APVDAGQLPPDLDRSVEQRARLAEVAAQAPERVEGAGEAPGLLGAAGLDEPLERGPQVIVLLLEPLAPGRLLGAAQHRRGLLGQRQEVVGVALADVLLLAAPAELLEHELADR